MTCPERSRGARAVACLCLLLTNCVAMPIVVPPMQLQVGSGVRSLAAQTFDGVDVPAQVRVGIHPMALFPKLMQRRGDFGVGYLLDYGANATLNGGYLEGTVNLLIHEMGGGYGRLGVRGHARLIHADPNHVWGGSGALQLAWDYATFADADFNNSNSDGGAFGHSYGEAGFGFFVEGAYLSAGTLHGWTATAGITVRIPAAYGIAYAWAWTLIK